MATGQYILMMDVQGEKVPGKFGAFFGSNPKTVKVLRGELITHTPQRDRQPRHDGKPVHNFHLNKDPSISLYGGVNDEYITPLIGYDLELLEAVENPHDRFTVLIEQDKLKWGGTLWKSDLLYVRLPGTNPTWSAAMVKHVGPVQGLQGRNFGVEIKEFRYLGRGTTNGYFRRHQYFTCAKNCGLFVSLDKLAKENPNLAAQRQPLVTQPPKDPGVKHSYSLIVKIPARTSSIGTSVDGTKFSINDQVSVYDKKNRLTRGIVRWTGRHVQTRTLDRTFIGIETVLPVVTSDFPKALTGVTHLFHCEPGHCLVVPAYHVFLHEESNRPTPHQEHYHTLPHYSAEQGSYHEYAGSEGSHHGQQPQQPANGSVRNANPYNLGVGSPVQLASTDPDELPYYGVIKWIGFVPGVDNQVAGIELDEYNEFCTDGAFKATGDKFFTCPHGRGLYFPLSALLPDLRIRAVAPQSGQPTASYDNPLLVEMEVQEDQFILDAGQQMMKYIGNMRGVQGHSNSCYLDSIIFGLFALNDVFDILFLDPDQSVTSAENKRAVSEQLWKGIVNPLRKNGVVRYESVMRMRNKLEELGKMDGITEKEKDPEEFLNMLFKHVLHTKPFISIKWPFGVKQEFFVQLLLESDPNLPLPSIRILLEEMFREQKISLTRVPSKLLIRIPRLGREFSPFEKIVPELRLSVRELTDSYKKVTPCGICGKASVLYCITCGSGQGIPYCQQCSDLYHGNTTQPERAQHACRAEPRDDDGQVAELDLLSVICIETSHYVCFTRDPKDYTERKWIFFDSMADRQYDTYNIPKVMDCSDELNEWVYGGDHTRLMSTQPRQLPELVRRFTQDVYMCVYIQPDVAMYGENDEVEDELKLVNGTGASVPLTSASICESGPLKEPHDVLQLKQQIASLMNEKQRLQQQIEASEIERKQLSKQAEQVVAEKQNLQAQLDNKTQVFQEHKKLLSEQTEQLEAKNSNLHKELNKQTLAFQEHRKQLSNQMEILETEKRQLQAELKEQAKTSQQQLATREEELSVCQTDLDSCTQELSLCKKELAARTIDVWKISPERVETTEQIGFGGWGTVSKGKIEVAVKHLYQVIMSPENLAKVRREIKLLAEVRHPNLVQFIGAVFDEQARGNKSPLIITELLNMNLREAYQQKQLRPGNRLAVLKDVARALDYLHQRYEPIIHRDVSAPNVLLQRMPNNQWKGKVSDLGSANFLQHAQTKGEGNIMYSPPEMIPQAHTPVRERIPQTTKIDVYSYGVLLCEVATSKMPSQDDYWEMFETVKRDYPQLSAMIEHCTKKLPGDRPTMEEILRQLEGGAIPNI